MLKWLVLLRRLCQRGEMEHVSTEKKNCYLLNYNDLRFVKGSSRLVIEMGGISIFGFAGKQMG